MGVFKNAEKILARADYRYSPAFGSVDSVVGDFGGGSIYIYPFLEPTGVIVGEKIFSFGENWKDFSSYSLTPERLEQAKRSLVDILGADDIKGKSFIDVGCGSGIFSICASILGAEKVVGIDVDPVCIEVSKRNAERYSPGQSRPEFMRVSILDDDSISRLGKFDVVYAWGSLHHTGNMWKAIKNSADLVKNGGILWLSIYNKHFTSPIWKNIKQRYNRSSEFGKTILVYFFAGIFFLESLVSFKNPFEKMRGMDFIHDVVDWVGGYPYEYASPDEVIKRIEGEGFRTKRFVPTSGHTGCNEFVLVKK